MSESTTLHEALQEWYFTENLQDHGKPIEDCELCNQEQLRYHFEIKNRNTFNCLWVGSSCILKFQVQVFDKGVLLNIDGAKKKLNALTLDMRLDTCIKALVELAATESNNILKNALEFYKRNQFLTPKYAFVVLWRLKINNIDHSPSFFKVSLKKDKYKKDLADMPLDRVHVIWSALSSSQRNLAISYGHSIPNGT
ncbi:hypothetical protein [Pseudoalteromonas umbrosa]|uniref:hypothetical protein n=1 Tax=Pseudoalteromonas umbrosa TaxID=3048489 RepID=UPI0024C35CCC|nr:hypothetical protein [Pseudoalteromonas sp. B95]MDK1286271.1 hypothetical protein [Pseudoalteromonas sp. B95]